MNKYKRRWVGSILTAIGFLSTLIVMPNKDPLFVTIPIWVLGVVIYRLGCDGWF